MRAIVLQDNDGVQISSTDGTWRIYVSLIELSPHDRLSHGFQILSDRSFEIAPKADNSILLKVEPKRS